MATRETPKASRLREALFWTGLAIALSPVLNDWLAHAAREWWARGSVLLALLALLCMAEQREAAAPRRDGYLLLALGLAVALVSVGGGMPRLGRPGAPIAILGMARVLGRPSPLRAASSLFMLPPPKLLMQALPGLHGIFAALAVHLHGDLARVGDDLRFGALLLPLEPADGGLPLCALLAGLGWIAAVRRGAALPAAARAALIGALLALPIQAAALCAALALLLAGHPDAARALLSHAPWLLCAGGGLYRIHLAQGRAPA